MDPRLWGRAWGGLLRSKEAKGKRASKHQPASIATRRPRIILGMSRYPELLVAPRNPVACLSVPFAMAFLVPRSLLVHKASSSLLNHSIASSNDKELCTSKSKDRQKTSPETEVAHEWLVVNTRCVRSCVCTRMRERAGFTVERGLVDLHPTLPSLVTRAHRRDASRGVDPRTRAQLGRRRRLTTSSGQPPVPPRPRLRHPRPRRTPAAGPRRPGCWPTRSRPGSPFGPRSLGRESLDARFYSSRVRSLPRAGTSLSVLGIAERALGDLRKAAMVTVDCLLSMLPTNSTVSLLMSPWQPWHR